jgi:hypothetical protein
MSTDFSIRPVGAPAPSPVVQPVSQAFYDRAAGAMVYQAVDQKTDEVVNQYPDEAVLRRRAYFNALELSKDNNRRAIPTDRVA